MRRLLWLAVLLVFTPLARGQGFSVYGQAYTTQGYPASNAPVRVCSITSTGIPCTPTVNIYSDIGLTNPPISNPTTTDANGNYNFFVAAPNNYTLQITAGGGQTYIYTVSAGVSSLNTVNVNNFINVMAAPYNAVCDGTTDDSAAIQSAINASQAAATPNGFPTVIIPSVCAAHGLRMSGYQQLIGNGSTTSKLILNDATANLLTVTPIYDANWLNQGQGAIKNITLAGGDSATTGTLLEIDGVQNFSIWDVDFFDNGGRGLVQNGSTERFEAHNTLFSLVRWPIISQGNTNESYYFNTKIVFSGYTYFAGTTNPYCYSEQCVNGVFPSSGTLFPSQYAQVYISGPQNVLFEGGSIKPNKYMPALQLYNGYLTENNFYIESGGQNSGQYDGGIARQYSLTAALSSASLVGTVASTLWAPSYYGSQSDLTAYGYANVEKAVIRPNDYCNAGTNDLNGNPCSTTYSDLDPGHSLGIFKATVEQVIIAGFTGTNTINFSARAQNGTTAVNWPIVGGNQPIVEEIPNGGAHLSIHNLHGHTAGGPPPPTGYTYFADDSGIYSAAEIVTGYVPDGPNGYVIYPGQPNAGRNGKALLTIYDPDMVTNLPNYPQAGKILCHSSCEVSLLGLINLSSGDPNPTPNISDNHINTGGSFLIAASYPNGQVASLDWTDANHKGLGSTNSQNPISESAVSIPAAVGTGSTLQVLNQYNIAGRGTQFPINAPTFSGGGSLPANANISFRQAYTYSAPIFSLVSGGQDYTFTEVTVSTCPNGVGFASVINGVLDGTVYFNTNGACSTGTPVVTLVNTNGGTGSGGVLSAVMGQQIGAVSPSYVVTTTSTNNQFTIPAPGADPTAAASGYYTWVGYEGYEMLPASPVQTGVASPYVVSSLVTGGTLVPSPACQTNCYPVDTFTLMFTPSNESASGMYLYHTNPVTGVTLPYFEDTYGSGLYIRGANGAALANGCLFVFNNIVQSNGTYPCTSGGGGGGATFPSTPGIVRSTSTTTSVNATAADIVGLIGTTPVQNATNATNTVEVNGAIIPASKTIVGTDSSSHIVDASSATLANNTTGNAATSTALAATPTICGSGFAAEGVLANGNAIGCTAIPVGSGSVTNVSVLNTFPGLTASIANPTTTPVLTLSPTGGLAANQVLATPNGTTGTVGLRALVPQDIPTATVNADSFVLPSDAGDYGLAINRAAASQGFSTYTGGINVGSSGVSGPFSGGTYSGTCVLGSTAQCYYPNPFVVQCSAGWHNVATPIIEQGAMVLENCSLYPVANYGSTVNGQPGVWGKPEITTLATFTQSGIGFTYQNPVYATVTTPGVGMTPATYGQQSFTGCGVTATLQYRVISATRLDIVALRPAVSGFTANCSTVVTLSGTGGSTAPVVTLANDTTAAGTIQSEDRIGSVGLGGAQKIFAAPLSSGTSTPVLMSTATISGGGVSALTTGATGLPAVATQYWAVADSSYSFSGTTDGTTGVILTSATVPFHVGQLVSGPGIPVSSLITAISAGTSITIGNNTTLAATSNLNASNGGTPGSEATALITVNSSGVVTAASVIYAGKGYLSGTTPRFTLYPGMLSIIPHLNWMGTITAGSTSICGVSSTQGLAVGQVITTTAGQTPSTGYGASANFAGGTTITSLTNPCTIGQGNGFTISANALASSVGPVGMTLANGQTWTYTATDMSVAAVIQAPSNPNAYMNTEATNVRKGVHNVVVSDPGFWALTGVQGLQVSSQDNYKLDGFSGTNLFGSCIVTGGQYMYNPQNNGTAVSGVVRDSLFWKDLECYYSGEHFSNQGEFEYVTGYQSAGTADEMNFIGINGGHIDFAQGREFVSNSYNPQNQTASTGDAGATRYFECSNCQIEPGSNVRPNITVGHTRNYNIAASDPTIEIHGNVNAFTNSFSLDPGPGKGVYEIYSGGQLGIMGGVLKATGKNVSIIGTFSTAASTVAFVSSSVGYGFPNDGTWEGIPLWVSDSSAPAGNQCLASVGCWIYLTPSGAVTTPSGVSTLNMTINYPGSNGNHTITAGLGGYYLTNFSTNAGAANLVFGDPIVYNDALNIELGAQGMTNQFTGTTDGSTAVILTSSTSALRIGQTVAGTGIPTNATITAIVNGTSITISSNTTVAGTNQLIAYQPNFQFALGTAKYKQDNYNGIYTNSLNSILPQSYLIKASGSNQTNTDLFGVQQFTGTIGNTTGIGFGPTPQSTGNWGEVTWGKGSGSSATNFTGLRQWGTPVGASPCYSNGVCTNDTGALFTFGGSTLDDHLGNLTTIGSATVGTSLTVNTTSTLTGNATVGGTLGVTGNTTLSGTLGTSGLATMNGGEQVNGTETIGTIVSQQPSVFNGSVTVSPTGTATNAPLNYTGNFLNLGYSYYNGTASATANYRVSAVPSSTSVANPGGILKFDASGISDTGANGFEFDGKLGGGFLFSTASGSLATRQQNSATNVASVITNQPFVGWSMGGRYWDATAGGGAGASALETCTLSGNFAAGLANPLTTNVFSCGGTAGASGTSGGNIFQMNMPFQITGGSSASTSALLIPYAPYSAGTTATNLPNILQMPSGTAATSWSANGTVFGIDNNGGFTGNNLDFHNNGGATTFAVDYAGNVTGLITNMTGTCTACTASAVGGALTLNNSNAGAASGTSYNGSAAITLSANTIGAGSLANANTWSAANLFSAAGAASTPTLNITGTPYAGTNANSFGVVNIGWGIVPPTTKLQTAGSAITVQEPSGSTVDFFNFLNNGTLMFQATAAGTLSVFGNAIQSPTYQTKNSGNIGWSATSAINAASDTILCRGGAAGLVTVESAATCTNTVAGATGQLAVASVLPGVLYSAAGTALPTCASALNGETAVVSDATSPTYMGAYASGGAITAAVICSYNGTSYGWKTH
jgi:hypothetical protein